MIAANDNVDPKDLIGFDTAFFPEIVLYLWNLAPEHESLTEVKRRTVPYLSRARLPHDDVWEIQVTATEWMGTLGEERKKVLTDQYREANSFTVVA